MKTQLLRELVPVLSDPVYAQATGFLVCVSGGVDSMVLLDALRALRHHHGLDVRVLHVDHGTGAHAHNAAAFVRAYCQQHEICVLSRRFEWSGTGNFEYQAATFRRRMADDARLAGELVALGHHQNDQAETVLMALARGAGLASPIGMAAIDGVRVRPLLGFSRRLILDHALRRSVPHRLDPTNANPDRLRNAIRHDLMPLLTGRYENAAAHFAQWVEAHQHLLKSLGLEWEARAHSGLIAEGVLNRAIFKPSEQPYWPFMLRWFWDRCGVRPNHAQGRRVERWLADGGCGRLQLSNRWIYCDLDGIAIVPLRATDPVPIRCGQMACWAGLEFSFTWTQRGAETFTDLASIYLLRGGVVRSSRACPKRLRERMRVARMPMRVRDRFPEIVFNQRAIHWLQVREWEQNGLCSVTMTGDDEMEAWVNRLMSVPSP